MNISDRTLHIVTTANNLSKLKCILATRKSADTRMVIHSLLGDFSASNPKLGSPTSVPLIPLFARDCIALQQIGCLGNT